MSMLSRTRWRCTGLRQSKGEAEKLNPAEVMGARYTLLAQPAETKAYKRLARPCTSGTSRADGVLKIPEGSAPCPDATFAATITSNLSRS